MERLSLPKIDCKIKQVGDNSFILDVVRKKYVKITPEEWVRQHFLHFMINQLGYPKTLIKVESGMTYNRRSKRTDIVAYSSEAKPLMLVECKAPEIRLKKHTFEQANVYNKILQADYVVITNGIEQSCFFVNRSQLKIEFLEAIPTYHEAITSNHFF